MNNIFPIDTTKETVVHKIQKDSENNFFISLPGNWWNVGTSYTSNSPVKLVNTQSAETLVRGNIKNSHRNWNVRKGDHYVRETGKQKDSAYYRELKAKLLKLLIFPFIILSGYFIYLISNLLSNIAV